MAVGHGIRLTEAQWDELDRVRVNMDSADVFRIYLIILMSDSCDTITLIAQRLGCGTDTVVRIRRLCRQGSVRTLYLGRSPGRRSRTNPEFIKKMKQLVQTNPMAFRHVFATWSVARLAQHLAKVTGIHFSDDQLRRLLHQGVFSINRPKHALKGKRDEQAYQKAKKDLIGSKKKMRDDAEKALLFQR